jgi:hypothetical protein
MTTAQNSNANWREQWKIVFMASGVSARKTYDANPQFAATGIKYNCVKKWTSRDGLVSARKAMSNQITTEVLQEHAVDIKTSL